MWAGTGTRDGDTGGTDTGERGPEVERVYMNTDGEWGAEVDTVGPDTGEQGAEVERVDIVQYTVYMYIILDVDC